MANSASIQQLIDEFARLPGIGPKTAERLTHFILQSKPEDAVRLAHAIERVKHNVRNCGQCFNLAESALCDICSDSRRDPALICVVEQPRDLMAIEKTGVFRGLYHVLLGRIAPLEGVTPDKLTIDALVKRVRQGIIKEIVMATNPTLEGDGTALYLSNILADYGVKMTRLARGLASGSVLEFANREMLSDAMAGRQKL